MFRVMGIGAFLFLSVQELSYLMEYILRDLHKLIVSEYEILLWFPELVGLLFFTIILIWTFKIGPGLVENNSNKIIVCLMVIFFFILFLKFLYPIFGTEFMLINYPEKFKSYFDARKNYITQAIIGVLQILKYVVFAVMLLGKRKTVANKT